MKKFYRSIFLSITLLFSTIFQQWVTGQISFPAQSAYRFLRGSQGATLPSSWMDPTYDDSGWESGNAPFWYGDGSGGTEITDMQNNYLSFYMRSEFTAANAVNIQEVTFNIDYDDGFALWINGDLVINQYAPTSLAWNDSATTLHESGAFESFIVSAYDMDLNEGTNTVAIMGFNANYTSSDFHFDMSIDADTDIPILQDSIGVGFSHPSGYYDTPFTLTMVSPDASANIVYTIDGSNPRESATAITGGSTVNLSIDPAITTGRGATPGFVVRASLTKAGYQPSYSTGRTYIFLDELLAQDYPGYDWPSGNVLGIMDSQEQVIDYEMDPMIVNDGRYAGLMEESFLDIPTLSVITSTDNLFDPSTGIYVNAAGHGIEWERECIFELFDPEGDEEGFNVNAGIRIRGGWSRHSYFAKHSFRVFFRSEYGEAKLRYPLFGEEGVDTYDKIDLRTSQNYAWAIGDSRNTMVREVFSRDMQGDMERPYTRSRYYHLFLNGMYWGLFQTQERSEARYASDYFGDSAEDYDVIKVSTENWSYEIEATDGNTNAWRRVWDKLQGGFEDNEDYFWLEGKDANGNPMPGGERLVDIDNLIDYMLGIFYTGNFDAPTSSFGSNKGPNNFYAIINRNDKDKGFMFFNHDAEHALFYNAAPPGIGINENRADIGYRADSYQMTVSSFYGFHPQWLHHKLAENEEYRVRFADRAVLFLSQGGELTPAKCQARFIERAEQIDMAIIAESARWGDQGGGSPYNKEDNWEPEIERVYNSFFPVRTNITISQLRNVGLYPTVETPKIYRNGELLTEQEYFINPGWIIDLENPSPTGTLYYTLDGTDPRKLGGQVRMEAIEGSEQNIMTLESSAIITARVYDAGSWSAIRQIKFYAKENDYSKLKITEINYHPQDIIEGVDTTSGKNFEFLEFKNTGDRTINLSGVTIDSAVSFEFPPKTLLGPGQFYVVVSKPSKFFDKYAMIGSGNFQGNLSNSGEKILVSDPSGEPVIVFTYSDQAPWPEMPDGNGPSLVSVAMNPSGNPALPDYWRASYHFGGSPFADDLLNPLSEESFTAETGIPDLLVYPNPTRGELHIQLSNWNTDPTVRLSILQIDGRLIASEAIRENTLLDLSQYHLETGIYLLKLDAANWSRTQKIIFTH